MKPINQRLNRIYSRKDARGNQSFLHAGVTTPNFVRLHIWQCESAGNIAPAKFKYSVLHIQYECKLCVRESSIKSLELNSRSCN